jgi:hypothetical protein
MKKNYWKMAAAAAMAGVMATSCGGSKQVAATSSSPQQQGQQQQPPAQSAHADQVKAIKEQAELEAVQFEAEQAKKQREVDAALAEAKRKRDIEQADRMAGTFEDQVITIPCFKDALDKKPEEYITGFGIGEPGKNDDPYDQSLVYSNALVMARNSIGEKWMGFIKNISNNYYAKTTVPAGTQASQANFERGVKTGGEKAINDFNAVLCQEIVKTSRGTYRCYIASRVPMEKIKLQVAKELEVLKVRYDQEVLFKSLEGELQKQADKDKEGVKNLEQGRPKDLQLQD